MQDQLLKAGYDVKIPEEYHGLNYFNIVPTDEEGRQRFRQLGQLFPREAILDFTITGSKKDCIEKIEKFIDAGVRNSCCSTGSAPIRTWRLRLIQKR